MVGHWFLLVCTLLVETAYTSHCGTPAKPPIRTTAFFNRIVGGVEAVKNSWPWQIHLGVTSSYGATQFVCGGTIISDKWVLTAAHCVGQRWATIGSSILDDPVASNYIVAVGKHDSSVPEITSKNYQVKRIIIFGGLSSLDNDVALLEMDEIITFNEAVSPVCLPPIGLDPENGMECVATGWGEVNPWRQQGIGFRNAFRQVRASSPVLRQAAVQIISRSRCNDLYASFGRTIKSEMICAGGNGRDSCQGDSGGPLVCKNIAGKYELVGVVSWGNGCGREEYPGVYANVGSFVSWIQQNTGI